MRFASDAEAVTGPAPGRIRPMEGLEDPLEGAVVQNRSLGFERLSTLLGQDTAALRLPDDRLASIEGKVT
jgi:hypothetical protein